MNTVATRIARIAFLFIPVALLAANAQAQGIGSTLISRPNIDGAQGQLFIFSGDTFTSGTVFSTFSFYANNSGSITPVLLERTASGPNPGDDQYIIRGIGTGRTISGSGVQTVAFGLQAGIDTASNANYTFGFTHSRLTATGTATGLTAGVIPFAQAVVGGTGISGQGTNAFRFTNNGNYFGTMAVGTVFGAGGVTLNDRSTGSQGFLIDRTYSAQANNITVVPEANAGILSLLSAPMFGIAAVVRRRK